MGSHCFRGIDAGRRWGLDLPRVDHPVMLFLLYFVSFLFPVSYFLCCVAVFRSRLLFCFLLACLLWFRARLCLLLLDRPLLCSVPLCYVGEPCDFRVLECCSSRRLCRKMSGYVIC
ncbi:hypothetical protein DVH24_010347 [Malus domestica]|uniref:Uncharacterized protein n=1 Tax=Malus domestica TaxID=3750 RepID=A0A498JX06_MALDO|nr:hypothetical protein DVH24_010347 [Malus domestica]